jgi:hypothetical protein
MKCGALGAASLAGSAFNNWVIEAIRVAVTSQSTRKRITPKLMNELAIALILRAVASDPRRVDQIRRYLRHAFGKSVRSAAWESTGRATDQLVKEALAEVQKTMGANEPGSSSFELAVRGAYPLVVSGRLNRGQGIGQQRAARSSDTRGGAGRHASIHPGHPSAWAGAS